MSTLSLASAIHDDVAAALEGIPGGYYRAEDSNGDAVVPSWWIHADSSAGLNGVQDAALVSVDVWHRNLGDLSDALASLEFLRDWRVYGVGTYSRQSVTVLHEAQDILHATVLISAVHFAVVA